MKTNPSDLSPNEPGVEALYAAELGEAWDLVHEYVESTGPSTEPSLLDTTYTFQRFDPPFMTPRAVRHHGGYISSVDAHVQRAGNDTEVEVAVRMQDDENDPIIFELTDIFGDERFVQTINGKVVDRSNTVSRDVKELLISLALTRDERIKVNLAKAAGNVTQLSSLGALSPLIESGLANNAKTINSRRHYDFEINGDDTYVDVTISHVKTHAILRNDTIEDSSASDESETFSVQVNSVKRDGGVKRSAVVSLEMSCSENQDSIEKIYKITSPSGQIETIDEDYGNIKTIENADIPQILQMVIHAMNLNTAAQTIAAKRGDD